MGQDIAGPVEVGKDPLQCAKVGKVRPAGQAAMLVGPRASDYESRTLVVVPEVWEVHRVLSERIENEVRRKASQSFQAHQVEAREAPNHREILGGTK